MLLLGEISSQLMFIAPEGNHRYPGMRYFPLGGVDIAHLSSHATSVILIKNQQKILSVVSCQFFADWRTLFELPSKISLSCLNMVNVQQNNLLNIITQKFRINGLRIEATITKVTASFDDCRYKSHSVLSVPLANNAAFHGDQN